MLLPNRHGSSESYRYGFQGQEKDDEIKGEGNSLNYTFRMHDPRVGRFFSPDPLEFVYPMLTPFQFAANTPVMASELEGLESSNDPNATQQGLDQRQSNNSISIPPSEVAMEHLEEVVITAKKNVQSNNDTRATDIDRWTSEVSEYGANMTFEQWKVLHGKKGENYTEAKARNKREWGTYWEQKFAQWDKEAREERLRQKLWLYTVYFYMAEDVAQVYFPANVLANSTAKVVSKSYSFKGLLAKNSDDIVAYRNFGADEYASFRANGNKFSIKKNGFGDKQFWLEEKGLEMWRSNSTFVEPFTIKIKIPKNMLQYERMLDGNRAISLDNYSLQKLNSSFKIEWIEIRPGNGLIP